MVPNLVGLREKEEITIFAVGPETPALSHSFAGDGPLDFLDFPLGAPPSGGAHAAS